LATYLNTQALRALIALRTAAIKVGAQREFVYEVLSRIFGGLTLYNICVAGAIYRPTDPSRDIGNNLL
jgi:hypothetical protein